MGSDSRNKARQKPGTSPVEAIPLADSAYHRPLPQSEKAEPRRLKPLLLGTGLVLFAILGVSAIYGSPLNWTFPTTKSQAIAGLSSAAEVLKADLEAITGQSAREEERSAAKPEVAGAFVDRPAAARVDEDLDYKHCSNGKAQSRDGARSSPPPWERRPCPIREGGGRETASRGARSRACRRGSLEWLAHRRENWEPGRGLGPA